MSPNETSYSCLTASNSIILWMTLFWRSYEERSVIQITLRFLPLCVCGVIANIIGSVAVARLVSRLLYCASRKRVDSFLPRPATFFS